MSRSSSSPASTPELRLVHEAHSLEGAFLNLQESLLSQGVEQAAIDQITPLDFKTSGGNKGPLRTHLMLALDIEGDGLRDIVWYSPATEPPADGEHLTIVHKPGLGEIAERGIGYELHKELANRNPSANIITHATEGFGPTASPISLLDLPGYGLDRMAQRGLRLLKTYCPGHNFIVVGTSMGTVVNHKLLHANSALPEEGQLKILGSINFVPAVVDPKNIAKDMLGLFPLLMAVDGATEMSVRTVTRSPFRMVRELKTLYESRPALKDVPLLARFVIDLAKGVPESEVLENAARYKTKVITGTWDSLSQVAMWERAGAEVRFIKGRGHGMALKPKEAAIKITATIGKLLLPEVQFDTAA